MIPSLNSSVYFGLAFTVQGTQEKLEQVKTALNAQGVDIATSESNDNYFKGERKKLLEVYLGEHYAAGERRQNYETYRAAYQAQEDAFKQEQSNCLRDVKEKR